MCYSSVKPQYQQALVLLFVLSKLITSQVLHHLLSLLNPHQIQVLANSTPRDMSQSYKPLRRGFLPGMYQLSAEEWGVADVFLSIDDGQHLIPFLTWKKSFTIA